MVRRGKENPSTPRSPSGTGRLCRGPGVGSRRVAALPFPTGRSERPPPCCVPVHASIVAGAVGPSVGALLYGPGCTVTALLACVAPTNNATSLSAIIVARTLFKVELRRSCHTTLVQHVRALAALLGRLCVCNSQWLAGRSATLRQTSTSLASLLSARGLSPRQSGRAVATGSHCLYVW